MKTIRLLMVALVLVVAAWMARPVAAQYLTVMFAPEYRYVLCQGAPGIIGGVQVTDDLYYLECKSGTFFAAEKADVLAILRPGEVGYETMVKRALDRIPAQHADEARAFLERQTERGDQATGHGPPSD